MTGYIDRSISHLWGYGTNWLTCKCFDDEVLTMRARLSGPKIRESPEILCLLHSIINKSIDEVSWNRIPRRRFFDVIPARRSLRSAHIPEKFHASKSRIKLVYVNIRKLCSQKTQTVQLQKSSRSCLEIAYKQVRMDAKRCTKHCEKGWIMAPNWHIPSVIVCTKGISSDMTAISISALQILWIQLRVSKGASTPTSIFLSSTICSSTNKSYTEENSLRES